MMEMSDEHQTTKSKKYEICSELSSKNIESSWIEVRRENPLSPACVENASIPCTIDEFFNKFLRDEAEYPFHVFQRDVVGDKDFEVSPWVTSSFKGFPCLNRTVKYVHPVNAGPMAPPSAHVAKEQCLRMYGEHGLCLDTRTTVSGVPISDCFHVVDRLLMEQDPVGGSSLNVQFEVCFTKNTMFKKIVRKTTGDEMKQVWQDYVSFVRKNLGEHPKQSEPTLMDGFISGFEEMTACAPLQELASEVVDDFNEAIATIPFPGCTPSNITIESEKFSDERGGRTSQPLLEEDIELTYLPTVGQAIKSVKPAHNRRQKFMSRKGAKTAEDRRQLIRGSTIQSIVLSEDSNEVLGSFRDAVVVALSGSPFRKSEHHCDPSFSVEVIMAGGTQ